MKKEHFHYHGKRIRAIVLDVDDTLVKTQEVFETICDTIAHHHKKDPQRMKDFIQARATGVQEAVMPMQKLFQKVYPDISEDEASQWVHHYATLARTHSYHPIHDAQAFLEQCHHRVHLGFCSNEFLHIATHRLETAQLNPNKYFPEKTRKGMYKDSNGNTIGHKKPNREALTYFATHFALAPEEILMVGDMEVDYEVAQNAGTHGAIILSGIFNRETMTKTTKDTNKIFNSLTDLLTHLQQ